MGGDRRQRKRRGRFYLFLFIFSFGLRSFTEVHFSTHLYLPFKVHQICYYLFRSLTKKNFFNNLQKSLRNSKLKPALAQTVCHKNRNYFPENILAGLLGWGGLLLLNYLRNVDTLLASTFTLVIGHERSSGIYKWRDLWIAEMVLAYVFDLKHENHKLLLLINHVMY